MPNWRSVGAVSKDVLFGVLGAELDHLGREYLSRRRGTVAMTNDRSAVLQLVFTRLSDDARKNFSHAVQERIAWREGGGRFSPGSLDDLMDAITTITILRSDQGELGRADEAVEMLEYLLADDRRLEEAVALIKRKGGLEITRELFGASIPQVRDFIRNALSTTRVYAKELDRQLSATFGGPHRPGPRHGILGKLWGWKMNQLYERSERDRQRDR